MQESIILNARNLQQKLKKFRLNQRLGLRSSSSTLVLSIYLLTLHLYLGPNQSFSDFLNVCLRPFGFQSVGLVFPDMKA